MKHYLKLIRFHFHLSFVTVLVGAFGFAPSVNGELLKNIVLCYGIFNVILYGGLYTFNDIIDRNSDAADPVKKERPIPSGKVSVFAAALFSASLIGSGLVLGWTVLSFEVFRLLSAFVVLNLAYTLLIKRAVYLNLTIIAATHTLRLILGATLAGVALPWQLIAAFYLLLFGVATTVHSMFNLREFERPYYPSLYVRFVQWIAHLVSSGLFLFSGLPVTWPVIAIALSYLTLALYASLDLNRGILARIFMIKTRTKV